MAELYYQCKDGLKFKENKANKPFFPFVVKLIQKLIDIEKQSEHIRNYIAYINFNEQLLEEHEYKKILLKSIDPLSNNTPEDFMSPFDILNKKLNGIEDEVFIDHAIEDNLNECNEEYVNDKYVENEPNTLIDFLLQQQFAH